VAARVATDTTMAFRYNIRMMGFGVDGPVNMFGDNKSVIFHTTIPSTQLKKEDPRMRIPPDSRDGHL
jgi:hypothetical protein